MDSRSSCHICPNRSWFKDFKEVKENVLLGDKKPCQILGLININMEMFDGYIIDLHDIRYVLDVKKNLISLCTLDANGCVMD